VYLYYLHIKTKNKKNSKNMKILESAVAGPLPATASSSSFSSLAVDVAPTLVIVGGGLHAACCQIHALAGIRVAGH
jgi:hypothetical protein